MTARINLNCILKLCSGASVKWTQRARDYHPSLWWLNTKRYQRDSFNMNESKQTVCSMLSRRQFGWMCRISNLHFSLCWVPPTQVYKYWIASLCCGLTSWRCQMRPVSSYVTRLRVSNHASSSVKLQYLGLNRRLCINNGCSCHDFTLWFVDYTVLKP